MEAADLALPERSAPTMRPMPCVICGEAEYRVLYEAVLPTTGSLDFAARRSPQRLHCRMVKCKRCGLVYSNPFFAEDVIKQLYADAAFIDEEQLSNMGADYVDELFGAIGQLPKDARILEVGCGNGFFLKKMWDAGYRNIEGVEPGTEAVQCAAAEVRPFIKNTFFAPGLMPRGSYDLICCFQFFDHMVDPNFFLEEFAHLLRPGGRLVAINHNIRSAMTRLLGERSPMYDIEHVYLFDRSTITKLLEKHGFSVLSVSGLSNSYTLAYAAKMFPMPGMLRRVVQGGLRAAGLSNMRIRLPAGNMLTLAEVNKGHAATG